AARDRGEEPLPGRPREPPRPRPRGRADLGLGRRPPGQRPPRPPPPAAAPDPDQRLTAWPRCNFPSLARGASVVRAQSAPRCVALRDATPGAGRGATDHQEGHMRSTNGIPETSSFLRNGAIRAAGLTLLVCTAGCAGSDAADDLVGEARAELKL